MLMEKERSIEQASVFYVDVGEWQAVLFELAEASLDFIESPTWPRCLTSDEYIICMDKHDKDKFTSFISPSHEVFIDFGDLSTKCFDV